MVFFDTQRIAEEANLFGLGFKILGALVEEHKIENGDTAFDEVQFVSAPIAKILPCDLAIEPARKNVVHHAALRETLDTGMPLALEPVPEGCGPFAPMRARKREELTGREITGMRGYNVGKTGLLLRAAECIVRGEL